jgi:uncharacterized protein
MTPATAPEHDVRVVDDPDGQRYEIRVGDALAGTIEYRTRPGQMWLIHTEVPDEYSGRGLGSRIVAGALEDIRGRGLKLVPVCPFVRSYVRRHPEDADLVVPSWANRT